MPPRQLVGRLQACQLLTPRAAHPPLIMRRTNPVSSDVVEGRVQARLRALHRSRLKAARAVLDDSGPPRYAHLEAATKAAPREQVRRSRVIARDNGLLVEKMVSILGRRPDPNHDPVQLAKAATATVEDAYRPGPIPLPKSLNKDARTRQLESIVLENERFLARLIGSPGVYSRREWARDSESESRYREQISRFPYRDPTACMPQVNPILAIAHAQTDRAAEMILKNQHAQWAQAQAQARAAQQLPPVPGASPHPSYDAVPPMRATGHVQSQTQARYPSPPTTAPTASTSSFQPAPPSAPRPNTTAPAGQTQRLRAQYTSQGVRVVRTGSVTSGGRTSAYENRLRLSTAVNMHLDRSLPLLDYSSLSSACRCFPSVCQSPRQLRSPSLEHDYRCHHWLAECSLSAAASAAAGTAAGARGR